MKKILLTFLLAMRLGSNPLLADEPATKPKPKTEDQQEVVQITFLITGLHCPPCTRTVEDSLRTIQGVKSVKVDWKTKNAHVQLDEHLLSAQQLAKRIGGTRHMMGGNMQYGGWLALKVPDTKADDDAAWNRLKEALGKTPGVKQVALYKAQSGVGVRFDETGELTSQKLISALAEAGFRAENY